MTQVIQPNNGRWHTTNMEKLSLDQWNEAPTSALVTYIIDHFHDRLKIQIPQINLLFKKELGNKSNKEYTADIIAAFHLFSEFAHQMHFHLLQEETVAFPLLLAMEKNKTPENLKKLTPIITAMEQDHQDDLTFIASIQKYTHNFRPPLSASENLKLLFTSLKELIQDLQLHIDMENNLVFKRFKTVDPV